MIRALSEQHTGLLIRMSYHRACVASKKIMQPLVRRGFAETTNGKTYELTLAGKQAAQKAIKDSEGQHLQTFGGISIGTEVMIVQDERRER